MIMPKYEVIILPLAEDDIVRNTDYIYYGKKSPNTARMLLSGFRKAVGELVFMPEMHELDEDDKLATLGIRKSYYKNYKIFFYIDEEKGKVFVLRVLHMLVDSKALLLNMFF